MSKHRLEQLPYRACCRLWLSGTDVHIAVDEDSIALHTDEQAEPIFFTANEARLLQAALTCAIEEVETQ